jgi:hypothetical protein
VVGSRAHHRAAGSHAGRVQIVNTVKKSSPLAVIVFAAMAGVNPAFGAPIPLPIQSSSLTACAVVGHLAGSGVPG